MINDKELQIAKESYVKKDFYQIYPEILDLVSKISKRWDPQSSNESDPGVVLLKLLAFIADKNNYNIDKNILEAFMPTASQESSMRKLCDMMGYNIQYYQSATTNVSFMFQGPEENQSFTLKAFNTVITNEDGDISYVLLKDVVFSKRYKTETGLAMEGVLCEAVVGDSNSINISNLDENNRFYFPELMVAENGIFVIGGTKGTEPWDRVDNLNLYPLGKYIYKFGFDSHKNLPYIEFPNDIATLIGEGLNIRYIRTTGVNGNISANTLTQFKSYTTDNNINLGDDDTGSPIMVISNLSSSTNGRDKETIDEAYNSFKRTVGTFDTLVTCRDYANKIYQLVQADNTTPLVSNIQVADIRDDINMSTSVVTYNADGLTKDTTVRTEDGPYDLVVYPFRVISGAYNKTSFNNSFSPDLVSLPDIVFGIEANKTIAHNIKLTENESDIYCIKNKYNISAQITTNYKVDSVEQAEILNNVHTALYKTFNARELEFGEPLVFDEVLACIKNADIRIKNVSLQDLSDVTAKVVKKDSTESNLFDEGNNYYKYIAKNVLAGRISLFDYDTNFGFKFGQQENGNVSPITNGVKKIDTVALIPYSSSNNDTNGIQTLTTNEVVQFRAPNFRTYVTYPAYVKYWMKFADDTTVIEANSEYALKQGDNLYISYTDTNDITKYIQYSYNGIYYYDAGGTRIRTESKPKVIIRPNFKLKEYDGTGTDLTVLSPNPFGSVLGPDNKIASLGVSEQIELRDYVKTRLDKPTLCYWIVAPTLDSAGNPIGKINFQKHSDDNDWEYTLQDGEHFFYTNESKTELSTLGSGTKLLTNIDLETSGNTFTIDYSDNIINEDGLMEDGLAAFSDINWKEIKFNYDENPQQGTYLDFQEMQTVTLTEKDKIVQINPHSLPSDENQTLNNEWLSIDSATYILVESGESESLPELVTGDNWEVRSRLDLNVGPRSLQHLTERDSVTAYDSSTTPNTYSNIDINTNYVLQKTGGDNISTELLSYDINSEEIKIIDDFAIMAYNNVGSKNGEYDFDMPTDYKSVINLDITDLDGDHGGITTSIIVPLGGAGVFLTYYTGPNDAITITSSIDNNLINVNYNNPSNPSPSPSSSISLKSGINIIWVANTCNLAITKASSSVTGVLTIGGLSILSSNKFNPALNIDWSTAGFWNILKGLAEKDGRDIFYYNYPIENDNIIDTKNMKDPFALYDYNNVYNKFVLSQLDTNPDGSTKTFPNITITAGSKL